MWTGGADSGRYARTFCAELLWTRIDELPGPQAITGLLDNLVENGQLDRAKAIAWGFVRSIDYWLWGRAVTAGPADKPVRPGS